MISKTFHRQISLFAIITCIILFCTAIPLVITSTYFYSQLKTNAYTAMEKDLEASAQRSFSSLDSTLLTIVNTYYTIISDPLINPELYSKLSDLSTDQYLFPDAVDDRLIKMMFYNTAWMENSITSITLYQDIDTYNYVSKSEAGSYLDIQNRNALDDFKICWSRIEPLIQKNERVNLLLHSPADSASLYYIRDYYDYSSGNFKGIVSLQIQESSLLKCFDDFAKYENSICLIYDRSGNILADTSGKLHGININEPYNGGASLQERIHDTANYMAKTSDLSNVPFTSAILIPLKPTQSMLASQLWNYLCIFFVMLFVTVLIAVLISRFISRYVNILIQKMVAMEDGDYAQTLPVYGIAEIDNLSKAFCNMSNQIKRLLEEVYANEVLLKESELKALQAQINPHFLFNTLLSISWKARSNKDMESYEMITALSRLLNANIYTPDTKYISIYEEIRNVRDYLFIQKSRFGDRLSFDIDIAPQILHEPILKLSIQPIVENAVVHGLENKTGIGHILIEGCCQEGNIHIQITDNGIGISPERLKHIMSGQAGQENGKKHHIGLMNTFLRMKYTYGEQYGLEIQSTVGKGTTVTIRYPYRINRRNSNVSDHDCR